MLRVSRTHDDRHLVENFAVRLCLCGQACKGIVIAFDFPTMEDTINHSHVDPKVSLHDAQFLYNAGLGISKERSQFCAAQ